MRQPFRGITTREVLVFQGKRFAEWSPFLEYDDQEASTWLKAAISWANDDLPKIHRQQIRTNATLPAVNPDQVAGVLASFGDFKTVKIKVAQKGEDLAQDLARVRKVHELYPEAMLRLDSNGGHTIEQALALAEQLTGLPIEYLEQPVASIHELSTLREKLQGQFKIAADESIRKSMDPKLVVENQAADILMLKAQPLGGITPAWEIASWGVEVVVSSALETSLGIAQGAYLAASLPELNYDCGLGTINLLAGDVTNESLRPENSTLEVRVIEPSEELLERYSASEDRYRFWEGRFYRCLDLL